MDTISQSKANMFFRCAEQFRRVYLDGERILPGIALHKGKSVHAGVEHENRIRAATGEDAPLDEVTDITRDTFVHDVKEQGVFLAKEEVGEKKSLLNASLTESIAMAKTYRNEVAPTYAEIAAVEERMVADIGLGLPLVGVLDFTADGRITDVKTASKRWTAGRELYEIQPTFYRILCRENGLGNLPAGYVILSPAKDRINVDVREAPRTNHDETILKRRLTVMLSMIETGIFPPAEPGSWVCSPRWCGFYYDCPFSAK
jgi:hypothetical protein